MGERLGKHSFQELMSQDQAWQTVLSDMVLYLNTVKNLKKREIEKVIFMGCGSSYYIALSASFIFSKLTGIDSKAVPASEILFYPEVYISKGTSNLLFAISRSGKTTEIIQAINRVKDQENITTLGLTCYEKSELAGVCDFTLVSRDGKEKSVVMTKSFTSQLLAIQLFSGLWAGDKEYIEQLQDLPQYYRENITAWRLRIEEFVFSHQFNKYEFLGQGNFYGLANEAMLKMKEMSIVPSEDFHSLEFRHGPKSIVDKKMLVLIYLGEKTYDSEKRLVRELKDYGAKLIIICDQADQEIKGMGELLIELKTGLSQFALTPLYLIAGQLLAYYTAVKKGIDVDNPRHLTQVVEI